MDSKLIAALLVLLTAGAVLYQSDFQSNSEFESWMQRFTPKWSSSEAAYREFIFLGNMAAIKLHNSNPIRTYDMAINQFTAMTDDEFAAAFLKPKSMHRQFNPEDINEEVVVPNSDINWITKGMVSPIKDQGQCGSCWAFSAIGTLESQSLMKGSAKTFSEQQLVDCSRHEGNKGCGGGFNYQGLAYVQKNGITNDRAYPYVAKNQGCKIQGGDYKISTVASTKGCPGLLTALASRPIGVSVDANNWSKYGSGIFNNCKGRLDHDVLLVAANAESYTIKNSWSSSWGENGYIRLALGNTCGICQDKSPWPV